ncbi:VCBS repeat-containing protein [Luteimonas sp. TWI662]|uniref:FG-GAP repeat domain-containing protein n=1 Tax=Luteimonas sp. TWI662 TaxID=3136789 RepID=UPI00320B4C58
MTGADARWVFLLGDFNADGVTDLYAINKQGTSSTEVHVLDGASHFQTFLMQTGTALHHTGSDSSWTFALGDYDRDGALDLYAIQKQGGGSNRTEVHVLNGATGFQSFLLHTATALHPTGSDSTWMFDLADYDRDGTLDLYAINRQGASSTEVHILDGATGFQSFKMQTATALHTTGHDPSWSFALQDQNSDGAPDLYAIRKQGGASGRTEVFILNGAEHFQTFLLQTATALHQTGSDHAWQILVAPSQ